MKRSITHGSCFILVLVLMESLGLVFTYSFQCWQGGDMIHRVFANDGRQSTTLFNQASGDVPDTGSLIDTGIPTVDLTDSGAGGVADAGNEIGLLDVPVGESDYVGQPFDDATIDTEARMDAASIPPPFFARVLPNEGMKTSNITAVAIKNGEMSRRQLFQATTLLSFGALLGGNAINDRQQRVHQATNRATIKSSASPKLVGTTTPTAPATKPTIQPSAKATTSSAPSTIKTTTTVPPKKKTPTTAAPGTLAPVNLTKVAAETNINVTMNCDKGCVSVDAKNFTKVQSAKVPGWLPPYLRPPPKVIKEISDRELLIASIVAGGATEMVRTSLLYPIQTIKTRAQTDTHNFTLRPLPIDERLQNLGATIKRHIQEGDLYAGIKPTLLVSVPATGVYFGVRDISKRMLAMTSLDDISIVLGAALVADVISLSFRAPADALALRLQNRDDDVGDWFGDSIQRLPMIILTDLPYLLSKILLSRQFIHGSISIDRYAEYAIFSAIVAALLTTPFDVARTRILVDSDGDFTNGIDGGSGEGLIKTMIDITKEGRGGIANLFAGWLGRVLYLGVGRAWLEPIQIIGYVGIRDSVLLQWF